MAEGVGFEPTRRFHACRFSRPVPSTTRPPLLSHANREKVWPTQRTTPSNDVSEQAQALPLAGLPQQRVVRRVRARCPAATDLDFPRL